MFLSPVRASVKRLLLDSLSSLSRRHTVMLPAEAGCDDSILAVNTTYRAAGELLNVDIQEEHPGRLSLELLGYERRFPSKQLWSSAKQAYLAPCRLVLDLKNGNIQLAGKSLGTAPWPPQGRRFCWRLSYTAADGTRRGRITGHYLPGHGEIDAEYYNGDNYVDHEEESAGEREQILDLMRQYEARGPMLEVGCASGGMLAALDSAGVNASYGVDVSQWAVSRATERLGPERAWVCDASEEELPSELCARGAFQTLFMWAVFEHFANPYAVLAKLTREVAIGGKLLFLTSNADSLNHFLFGSQWEGHFDWTHFGVEQVSVTSIKEQLPKLNWKIEHLTTYLAWDCNPDPTHATVREWYGSDARFRRLLVEKDLGDLIVCVATKTS